MVSDLKKLSLAMSLLAVALAGPIGCSDSDKDKQKEADLAQKIANANRLNADATRVKAEADKRDQESKAREAAANALINQSGAQAEKEKELRALQTKVEEGQRLNAEENNRLVALKSEVERGQRDLEASISEHMGDFVLTTNDPRESFRGLISGDVLPFYVSIVGTASPADAKTLITSLMAFNTKHIKNAEFLKAVPARIYPTEKDVTPDTTSVTLDTRLLVFMEASDLSGFIRTIKDANTRGGFVRLMCVHVSELVSDGYVVRRTTYQSESAEPRVEVKPIAAKPAQYTYPVDYRTIREKPLPIHASIFHAFGPLSDDQLKACGQASNEEGVRGCVTALLANAESAATIKNYVRPAVQATLDEANRLMNSEPGQPEILVSRVTLETRLWARSEMSIPGAPVAERELFSTNDQTVGNDAELRLRFPAPQADGNFVFETTTHAHYLVPSEPIAFEFIPADVLSKPRSQIVVYLEGLLKLIDQQ